MGGQESAGIVYCNRTPKFQNRNHTIIPNQTSKQKLYPESEKKYWVRPGETGGRKGAGVL